LSTILIELKMSFVCPSVTTMDLQEEKNSEKWGTKKTIILIL